MTMQKYLTLCGLIVLGILMFLSHPANGCSCMMAHPQNHYCNADYVIIARVLRKSSRLIPDNFAYKIEIKRSYKMNDVAQKYLKHGRIVSSQMDSMCGVNLEIGKLYVIAGRGHKLTLCDYVKEYTKMSIVERRGFAGIYKKGCECNVRTCFHSHCQQAPLSCTWSPFAKCETSYSVCVPGRDVQTPEGPIASCHWRRSPPYKACLSAP